MPSPLNIEIFVERSRTKHGNKYDYSRAIYVNNLEPIEIGCRIHGTFRQRPSHHMNGIGCPKCKADKTAARCSKTAEDFIAMARDVHGDLYDYSKVNYEKSNIKVEIVCKAHGSFHQTPNNHISSKSGCPKCAGKMLTNTEVIDKLHMLGRGCNQCWHESYSSKAEIEIAEFMESLGARVIRNDRTAINGLEIDVYLPDKKLGIEYNGKYWHSDRVSKNTRMHEFKHAEAARAGVRLISIWDFDWDTKRDIVKRMLRNAAGASNDRRIHARDCAITMIGNAKANAFYETNHIQGATRGGVASIGLAYKGELVAAMTFTKGGTRRGKAETGEWELARYATSEQVRGGASKLFAAFVRQHRPDIVWSFSDNQHFGGALYHALGFKEDGRLNADYRLVHRSRPIVWHKSLWQRKSIPKRLAEIGSAEQFDPATDPRTEKQMHDAAGVLRIWCAGETRWRWVAISLSTIAAEVIRSVPLRQKAL